MADEETEALERFKLAGLFTKVKWLSWDLNMEGLAPTLVLLTTQYNTATFLRKVSGKKDIWEIMEKLCKVN